jgi:hypothetical protein
MRTSVGAFALAAAFGAAQLDAQQPAGPATATPAMPAVGDMAPDFRINGATRYGLLAERPMLSQLRGQTVVLAFFVVARTRG